VNKQYQKGFTFIELLITLAVVAIAFLPLMRMYTACLEQVYVNEDMTTARYLAQEGMEKIKNLGFTEDQLKKIGDLWYPSRNDQPLKMNDKNWRVLRKITKNTDPLEVKIEVYLDHKNSGISSTPIIELVTLIEDLDWE
jgi:prepilin-type N-terminal cleavage/methylation domain-containing protein